MGKLAIVFFLITEGEFERFGSGYRSLITARWSSEKNHSGLRWKSLKSICGTSTDKCGRRTGERARALKSEKRIDVGIGVFGRAQSTSIGLSNAPPIRSSRGFAVPGLFLTTSTTTVFSFGSFPIRATSLSMLLWQFANSCCSVCSAAHLSYVCITTSCSGVADCRSNSSSQRSQRCSISSGPRLGIAAVAVSCAWWRSASSHTTFQPICARFHSRQEHRVAVGIVVVLIAHRDDNYGDRFTKEWIIRDSVKPSNGL